MATGEQQETSNRNLGSCEIDWVSTSGKMVSQKGDISFKRLKEYVLNGDSQLLRVSFISKEAAEDISREKEND